jgi:hypothetical protein
MRYFRIMGYHHSSRSVGRVTPSSNAPSNMYNSKEEAEEAIDVATSFTVPFFQGTASFVTNIGASGIELFIQEFYLPD